MDRHLRQEWQLQLPLLTAAALLLQALRRPRVKTEASLMARMDTNTPYSALEIPLQELSPVRHLTVETTHNVSVPVMQTMRVELGRGFPLTPIPIVGELVISRGDRKHALRRTEMA